MNKPKRQRAAPTPPPINELVELLRRPHFFMHCGFRSVGFERHKTKPTDRLTLAIVERDGWQFTATFDDVRGYFVSPPPVYYGVNDWQIVGRRDGSTYFRRPKKPPPWPRPPLDYVEPGFISNAEFRKRMGMDEEKQ